MNSRDERFSAPEEYLALEETTWTDVYEHVELPSRPMLRAIYERPEGVGYQPLAEAL